MPEIFRFYGFSFFFYSKEHEPLHVHVEGNGGMAKYDLIGSTNKNRQLPIFYMVGDFCFFKKSSKSPPARE